VRAAQVTLPELGTPVYARPQTGAPSLLGAAQLLELVMGFCFHPHVGFTGVGA